jgi:MFS family permease
MVGSLFSGKASDRYGRKKPLMISSILMFIIALYCGFSFDFWFFMIFRILFGLVVGFAVPISFTMLAECSPVKQRGFLLVLIGVFYTLGELWVCLISLITMDSLDSGHWRLMLALSSLPGLLVALLCYFCLMESPRFLAFQNRFDESL